jgi:hypothetical protein
MNKSSTPISSLGTGEFLLFFYQTPYTNVFDNNLETYFERNGSGLCWVGIDLGEPERITRISYCQRSDTNFIIEGETYELCYWKNGEWISMGEQIAKKQFLIYRKVPLGAMYILHNLTKGVEERIFTYENGKQVFWEEPFKRLYIINLNPRLCYVILKKVVLGL